LPCFQLGWRRSAVSWKSALVVEAQDLTWKPRADQVDVVALAVKCADDSARAFLGNLRPDGVVSDHGSSLKDRFRNSGEGKIITRQNRISRGSRNWMPRF